MIMYVLSCNWTDRLFYWPNASMHYLTMQFVLLVGFWIRAVCEYAYTLVQGLDPNSEGRGVLQFKTGLLSVIKVLRNTNGEA